MNTQLLIDSIVRQTTVLIAQLATAGGARTPVADVAHQVFVELARELERQGVSRKVAADMFGIALRSYRRKIQRLAESKTVAGRSLWEAVHAFVKERPAVTRAEVMRRFGRDDEEIVRGVLQDLVESGLVYHAGRGAESSYRVASPTDLDHVERASASTEDVDMLVWALVYRLGPIDRDAVAVEVHLPVAELDAALDRLVGAGQIARTESRGRITYGTFGFAVALGGTHGWEAAVFDHFQAVVTTIAKKLKEIENEDEDA